MSSKSRNVYTPFFRRFTDEHALDVQNTAELQRSVLGRWNSIWRKRTSLSATVDLCMKRLQKVRSIPKQLHKPFGDAITDILERETPIFGSAELERPVDGLTMPERVAMRRALHSRQYFLDNEERVIGLLVDGIVACLGQVVLALPHFEVDKESPLSISLLDVLNPGVLAETIFGIVASDEFLQAGLFTSLQDRLYINACIANGVEPYSDHKTLKGASEFKAASQEVVETFLSGTSFYELFHLRLPWRIPESVRSTHILMIAPTGSGKTQWIQQDIFDLLCRPDAPGMVVIDSQNQMIPKVERLRIARNKIVIIDPFDEVPPPLNMFIMHKRKLSAYSREIAEAQTLEQFAWVFSALDQDLSGRMKTLFSFTVRILMNMAPHSNMRTMLEFLRIERPAQLRESRFWDYIQASDEDTRYFFEERFCTGDYNRTKAGVADRLLGVLRIPAFARMFTASDNRLDMYEKLAQRKIILFNTNKSGLQSEASAVLGRYAIALYIKAAFERSDDRNPPPAFLYIDEASEYFGEKDSSDTLFTQLRKFDCGSFAAFQESSQMGEQSKILMANTATKIVARLEPDDAARLAPALRTSPAVLQTKKEHGRFHMAAFIKDVTPHALTFSFPYGAVENAPQLTDAEHRELREANRRQLGARTNEGPSKPESLHVPPREPPAGDKGSAPRPKASKDDTRHTKPVKE